MEIQERFQRITDHLDEKTRRLWCANEALAIAYGGVSLVSRQTGVSRTTITEGVKEIKGEKELPKEKIRRDGGGRKLQTTKDKKLKSDVKIAVESSTIGDPESPLKWCSKSLRNIADEINKNKKRLSYNIVARILTEDGYSLQANRKTFEGSKNNPDRDKQFNFINKKVKEFQKKNFPVLSVDTKKKENIGNFKNSGQEYCKKGNPTRVNVYDFIDEEKGKVSPYGVYDLDKNKGWVNVGISSDTAMFAVNSIRTWWYGSGSKTYKKAKEILITADCGGSNGYRVRLWKVELQKLATELQVTIHVSHFPPGTSKWNKIEHKLFCFISKNWRGKPLIDRATVVNLIGNTKTKTGLTVEAVLDENIYEKGIKISDEELNLVKLEKDDFHGEWNYRICS
ncbi:MAG: ISAzo13 family transposase [Candidatus Daviesbacteria bacterium]|nr:ISAzo13 family transposase [Candidatus Daviesbacteria bacterium]